MSFLLPFGDVLNKPDPERCEELGVLAGEDVLFVGFARLSALSSGGASLVGVAGTSSRGAGGATSAAGGGGGGGGSDGALALEEGVMSGGGDVGVGVAASSAWASGAGGAGDFGFFEKNPIFPRRTPRAPRELLCQFAQGPNPNHELRSGPTSTRTTFLEFRLFVYQERLGTAN